jgi:hypothetical protein
VVLARLTGTILLSAFQSPANFTVDLGSGTFGSSKPGGELAFNSSSSMPPRGTCNSFTRASDPNGMTSSNLPLLGAFNTGSPLDAGPALTVNGPNGSQQLTYSDSTTNTSPYMKLLGGTLPVPLAPGSPLFLDPGNYTITGNGGRNVGALAVSLSLENGTTWTNRGQLGTIDRSAGFTINWTGGNPSTQVGVLIGLATDQTTQSSGTLTCVVPLDSGSFTVPPAVLANMPKTTGGLADGSFGVLLFGTVAAGEKFVKFTAPGLDYGYAFWTLLEATSVNFR